MAECYAQPGECSVTSDDVSVADLIERYRRAFDEREQPGGYDRLREAGRDLPFLTRPVCLPVACRRWQGKGSASTVDLARDVVTRIAQRLAGRAIHVVADAA